MNPSIILFTVFAMTWLASLIVFLIFIFKMVSMMRKFIAADHRVQELTQQLAKMVGSKTFMGVISAVTYRDLLAEAIRAVTKITAGVLLAIFLQLTIIPVVPLHASQPMAVTADDTRDNRACMPDRSRAQHPN